MAGIVHGGGLTAAVAAYGGAPEDWLDLSTGINPRMAALPVIPAAVWNRLPDAALVEAARAAAGNWYVGAPLASGVLVPPSVLPDISPTRGENGKTGAPRIQAGAETGASANPSSPDGGETVLHRFSPLVGEMSGRTEGGVTDAAGDGQPAKRFHPLPIPGTQALIQILPRLLPPGRPVAIVSPTYGEYAHCFARAGFAVDPIRSMDDLNRGHGTLVVVNPNNPDGRTWSRQEILDLHVRMHDQGAHLHVDEAFGDARPELSVADAASHLPGLTVSRSFGKFFGLAGLRLGFLFAAPELLVRIEAELGPWAVSGPALFIASRLMARERSAVLGPLLERRAGLQAVLTGAGCTVAGGTELFALVETPDASEMFEHLCHQHILVRKFDYAPTWLRIGLTADEQGDRRLAGALASFGR